MVSSKNFFVKISCHTVFLSLADQPHDLYQSKSSLILKGYTRHKS